MTQVYSPNKNTPSSYTSPSTGTSPPNPFSSVHRLSDASSADVNGEDVDGHSIMTLPPPYTESTTFFPTLQLQVETPGKPLLSLPLPPHPDPIPVFDLTDTSIPRFVSLRPTRGSGSCFLVSPSSGSSPSRGVDSEEYTPLSTTQYRFGPGRHPRIRLFTPGSATPTSNPFQPSNPSSPDATPRDEDIDLSAWDAFELLPVGLLTRATTFRTRLGTFSWRYATRAERKAAGADSLLVLDRVVRVARAQNIPHSSGSNSRNSKDEEIRTPIAHFVRNETVRTRGSTPRSAGNGGRLLVDLRSWEESGGKMEREMAVVMVVTTCLAMLKKEVDRRRAQQIAVMAGAASGGP